MQTSDAKSGSDLSSPSRSQEAGNDASCRASSTKPKTVRPIPPRAAGGLFLSANGRPGNSRTVWAALGLGRRAEWGLGPRSGPAPRRPLVLVPYLNKKRNPAQQDTPRHAQTFSLQNTHKLIWSCHSTNKGDATSQTALTATEGLKHVLCFHDHTKKIGRITRLWKPRARCLDQRLTVRSPDRMACCPRTRPRNFKVRSNVLNQSPELPQLLTIEQAAQRLAVNKRTLYREIARGCFPKPIKIRRMARIRAEDLLRYVDSLTSGQPLQGGAA